MDNNTPFSDDPDNSEPSPDSSQEFSSDISDQGANSVNKKNTPVMVIALGLFAFAVYMVFSIFSDPKKPTGPDPTQITGKTAKVAPGGKEEKSGDKSTNIAELPAPPLATLDIPPPPTEQPNYIPPLISPPPLPEKSGTLTGFNKSVAISDEPPPPPPLPLLVPPTPEINEIGKSKSLNLKDKDAKQRIRSNMLVLDNNGSKDSSAMRAGGVSNDPNSSFSDSVIRATTAEKAIATGLNNLNMTIAQGKIINAVLETAINTDLPGTLRAIVSRDTYAETGRGILIPKGTRLIGTYNTGITRGQNRVMIVWTRLIRPDGIDIMIGSPGVDQLGRAGLIGDVDNKLYDIFSAAILTTAITLGAAVGSDAILPVKSGQQSSTTTNANGNTTTTATPAQQSAASAVSDFGSTAKQVVQRIVDIRPTITIDQGTLINVFVNRDLTFPNNLDGGMFVQ